ncbi:DUF317 domain-containing protein [Streptomyces sp. NPDC055243]|uniref:DUF317 domain-containing protein n=1 Tax=Streptomyces sp. NPDC055243 TaxID=3365720 RepID=UPI0037D2B23F
MDTRREGALVSPDGTTYVHRSGPRETGTWFVTTEIKDIRQVWQARFGAHTPAHLIAAFTTALADPAAVPRADALRSLPTYSPKLITVTRREVPAVQVASALEERVRSLAARRASPPVSPSPLRHPAAKNGRSR